MFEDGRKEQRREDMLFCDKKQREVSEPFEKDLENHNSNRTIDPFDRELSCSKYPQSHIMTETSPNKFENNLSEQDIGQIYWLYQEKQAENESAEGFDDEDQDYFEVSRDLCRNLLESETGFHNQCSRKILKHEQTKTFINTKPDLIKNKKDTFMGQRNDVMIDGVWYKSAKNFNCKRKILVNVAKNRYWAIADTSTLVFDQELFKKLVAWINEKISEYKTFGKNAFRRETRIGQRQRQTSYISESQEFATKIGTNRSTVQTWIKQYLIATKGLKPGRDLYEKVFSSNPQRKQIPWDSYEFLQDLVKDVSIRKIGNPAGLITTPSDLSKIIAKNNSESVKIKKEKIIIECPIHGEFKKRYVDLYEGQWCRQCANEEMSHSYGKIKDKGEELGYFLKDDEDIFEKKRKSQIKAPTYTILEWICIEGHMNYKSLHDILTAARDGRYGCKKCYRLSIMITYEEFLRGVYESGFKTEIGKSKFSQIKEHCIKNNLILTHDLYFNITCSEEHTFPAFYVSITSRTGIRCPYCGMSALQKRVHLYMESALRVAFESEVDLRRIISKETRYLKMDGYAEIFLGGRLIKVIFEAMGEQHRFFVEAFHKSPKDFRNQKERDEYLQDVCRDEDIILIKFWYDDDVSQYKNLLIRQFYRQTKELGIFKDGYSLKNIPQFTSRIIHNKFLGATQTNQKSLSDFFI